MNITPGDWAIRHTNLGDIIETPQRQIAMVVDGFTEAQKAESAANAQAIIAVPRMLKFIRTLATEGNREAIKFLETLDLS